MLRLKSFFGALLLLVAGGSEAPVLAEQIPTVVELFTSQGCSSCPPADAFMGELAKREDIIALSFNVDYWDYLGWEDTLASPANTQRQRDYAEALQRRVYTPQMIVGGTIDVVGSDRKAVLRAIQQVQGKPRTYLPIAFSERDGKLLIRIGDRDHTGGDATIWLVRFDTAKSVDILRGENTGRKITYHNIVKDFWTLGMWRGKPMEIALRLDELDRGDTDGCAVIVQKDGHGAIIGAAEIVLDLPPS